MIIWINGAFGSGKTTTAYELHRRLAGSFVYDPENVGYFIRHNAPSEFSDGDFQDYPLWREMNYKLLRMIAEKHDNPVIVPMTLVNPDYFDDIVGRLTRDGVDVRHFILYVSRGEIRRRIKRRTIPIFGKDAFAMGSVDRCVDAFESVITGVKVYSDNMRVDDVVERIAELCGVTLTHGRISGIGKLLFRLSVIIKHIR